MPGMKEIKNRINSVSDTRKITNAMYLIASTKLRKARQEWDKTKPYFESLEWEMQRIFQLQEDTESDYFFPASIKSDDADIDGTYGYLVITADKGLAGAYSQNVIKTTLQMMQKHDDNKLFVVGEVGRHYFNLHKIPIEQSFLYSAQSPNMLRAAEISEILLDMYNAGELSKIYVIYTNMKNSISQEVCSERLLPLHRADFLEDYSGEYKGNIYEFMPNFSDVLDAITPNYLTGYIYSALVDSFCCEQNARMMAMDSANTNADELLGRLRVEYNHLRQNAITQEITEVAAGAKAKRKKAEKEKQRKKKSIKEQAI